MKHFKRIGAALLCALILAVSLPVTGLAGSAGAILIFSSSTVTVGENVSVTVKYTGDEPIGSWHYELRYDAARLEYVSGADSGGSGTLNFVNSLDEGKTVISQTVTFRAINAGDAVIKTNALEIVSNASMTRMNTTDASAPMHIKASPSVSGNADLGNLTVSPGTLTPAFSSLITDYTMTVSNSVTSLNVSADTYDVAASASISGTSLAVGANTITVTVTAGNGVQKFYRITVTRLEAPATQAAPVTPGVTSAPKTTAAPGVSTAATTAAPSDVSGVSASDGSTVNSTTTENSAAASNKETTESYAALKQRADKAEGNLHKARVLLLAVAAAFVLFTAVVITVIVLPKRKAKRGISADTENTEDDESDYE